MGEALSADDLKLGQSVAMKFSFSLQRSACQL